MLSRLLPLCLLFICSNAFTWGETEVRNTGLAPSAQYTQNTHTPERQWDTYVHFYLPVGPSSHPAVNHCLIMCPEITEHRCPVHVQLKLSGLKLTLLISQQWNWLQKNKLDWLCPWVLRNNDSYRVCWWSCFLGFRATVAGWWWGVPKPGQPRHNAPGLTTHWYVVRAEQPAGTEEEQNTIWTIVHTHTHTLCCCQSNITHV